MKLINADYVKEVLETYRYHSFNLDDALHVIEEAPEVKAYTKRDMIMEYMKGYKRSIGHWIQTPDDFAEFKCSNCDKPHFWKDNYCPNCGAYMKGGINNAEQ